MLMPSIFGESLLDDFFGDDFGRTVPRNSGRYVTPSTTVMKTDIKEREDEFEIEIDLPGDKKEDVSAELKDGYMTISASKNVENDEKDDNGKYIRRERFCGNCSRSFYVGKTVSEDEIKAKFEDGILRLTVPKKDAKPATPQKKLIAIEG